MDNVWKCSKDYPTVIDEKGNLNNVLDLRYLLANNQNNNVTSIFNAFSPGFPKNIIDSNNKLGKHFEI